MQIINDEKELYTYYADQILQQTRIVISVNEVAEEKRDAIASGIKELLAAEIIRHAYDELRARGVSEQLLDGPTLRTSLKGLPLSERDRTALEAQTRRLAVELRRQQDDGGGTDNGDQQRSPEQTPTRTIHQALEGGGCICAASWGYGTFLSLASLNPLPTPPPGRNFLIIAIALHVDNIWGATPTGDLLRLIVEPGAAFGLGPNEMLVGLASEVDWAKEIWAWNLCRGRIASVQQNGRNDVASYMLLNNGCNGAHTIVFSKPQFFGVWADVNHLDLSLFWTLFGGKRLTFTWVAQGDFP